MDSLKFSGKAGTLRNLQGQLQFAQLLPQIQFSVQEWLDAGENWESLKIGAEWLTRVLMVRSSAKSEDQSLHSRAGEFLSVANVKGSVAIQNAVQQVVENYGDGDGQHQILIQPMVMNIEISGVAFSYEPGQPGPYYVVNYDVDSKQSHQVTQGLGDKLKTLYLAKSADIELCGWKGLLIKQLNQLEKLFGNKAIDVEFVITTVGELILLQARPLVLAAEELISVSQQKQVLAELKLIFRQSVHEVYPIKGECNLLGVMPDWNPAEIIGLRPNPLAFSLYQKLVTNLTWAEQRREYGYRDVRGVPLMLDLFGMPYIDVRASFNSFIPKILSDSLAAKLVNFYLQQLKSNPQWHDKIEFEIVFASDHFQLKDSMRVLLENGFSKADCDVIGTSLAGLTHNIIDEDNGAWVKDWQKVKELIGQTKRVLNSSHDDKAKLADLLEVCREFGARPFAGLARTAFIARRFLDSLVGLGVFSKAEYARFMQSLSALNGGILGANSATDRNEFLERFGHMRPGIYDLTAPRYDQMPPEYFSLVPDAKKEESPRFVLTSRHKKQLDCLLSEHGYDFTATGFMQFVQRAIERREKAKYIYSQALSEILTLCQRTVEGYQLADDQLAYLSIDQIMELPGAEAALNLIDGAKNRFKVTRSLILPPLITNESDIDCFELQLQQANFITLNKVTGMPVRLMLGPDIPVGTLKGKIVLLTNADPGFDWLFTHKIAGLVTLYGGCNSHMAIRTAELGLPAVIGAGEVLFELCANARLLCLDCEQQRVIQLQ